MGKKKNLKNIKLAILWGENIILAMRGPQRYNEFGKAVIDNVYTLPRFAMDYVTNVKIT